MLQAVLCVLQFSLLVITGAWDAILIQLYAKTNDVVIPKSDSTYYHNKVLLWLVGWLLLLLLLQ